MADCCSGGTKLIYSCSGSADVGELADRTARRLRDQGFAAMTCLAGVGANLSGFVESAKGADENIAIDGCPTQCAKKTLERIGVPVTSIMLADLGYKKGESQVTPDAIDSIARLIKSVSPVSSVASSGCGCGGN